MKRRSFLRQTVAIPALSATARMGRSQATEASTPAAVSTHELPRGRYQPGRVPNEYSLLLPGERDALKNPPRVIRIEGRVVTARWGEEERSVRVGESIA